MYYPPEAWDYNECYALERVLEETKSTIGVLERVKDEEGIRTKKTSSKGTYKSAVLRFPTS